MCAMAPCLAGDVGGSRRRVPSSRKEFFHPGCRLPRFGRSFLSSKGGWTGALPFDRGLDLDSQKKLQCMRIRIWTRGWVLQQPPLHLNPEKPQVAVMSTLHSAGSPAFE